MTAIDQPVQLDLGACDWCDHDQWGHVRGKKACRDPGCPCTEYTAPKRAKAAPAAEPMPADDWPLPAVEVEDAEAAGLVVRPESPAAEPEPTDDEVAAEIDRTESAAEVERLTAELAEERVEVANLRRVNVELGRARGEIERLAREKRELVDERDKARRDRDAAAGEAEDARRRIEGLAGELEHHRTEAAELRAALQGPVPAGVVVLWQYDADQCTTDGCGSRYTVPVEHEHPLTPVTVLVVEREVPGA